jgi:hypothetical protein
VLDHDVGVLDAAAGGADGGQDLLVDAVGPADVRVLCGQISCVASTHQGCVLSDHARADAT